MNNFKQMYITSPYLQHCDKKPFKNAWIIFPDDEPICLKADEWLLLCFCSEPVSYGQLINRFSKESISKMMEYDFLVEYETAWHIDRLQCVEIETSKYCNWRCCFCPNKDNMNLRKEVKSIRLFYDILQKIQDFALVKYVTLNSYNEPTLDPLFIERIRLIKKFNIELVLYTNGSALTHEHISELKESGCLREIWFNLPSLQPERFTELTGYPYFNKIIDTIDEAINAGLCVNFSIQGQAEERQKTLSDIRERYQNQVKYPIVSWPTHDRAGSLKGLFNQHIDLKENCMFGCTSVIAQMHINVFGETFLCCNDYYQKHKFGNIQEAGIFQLLNNEKAISIRKQVYGKTKASDDLICRNCIEMKRQKVLYKLSHGKSLC